MGNGTVSRMHDPGAELVAFEDVLFISDGLVPICEYKGLRYGIPFRVMEHGSTIHAPGDRGRLVLARAVAEWLKML